MTESELQGLSRKAAGCLPDNFSGRFGTLWTKRSLHSCGTFVPGGVAMKDQIDAQVWLHESTEACTEIMVRVLWPANCMIAGNLIGAWAEYPEAPQGSLNWTEHGFPPNPMLAYRVSVLKALIALKG